MSRKKLVIGLFGFGVVGEGIYQVLRQTPALNASIKRICIKNPDKKRNAPCELFTTSCDEILNDPDINLVVELTNDAQEAYRIVTTAFRKGKSVVSANKQLVADHLAELIFLQEEYGVSFLYEAAVCASIPVVRNLEEYYDNDLLRSVTGVVNGSTNFMLTRMSEGISYGEALRQAQELGFAETDPSLDVEGKDAANKLVILLAHAYGIIARPEDLLYLGITRLTLSDASYAVEKNYRIRLTAQAVKLSSGKVAAFVLPQFVDNDSLLYRIRNEYNGVVIESRLADSQFLYGKGAGRYPTASAVSSDISAISYNYRYEYKKLQRNKETTLAGQYFLQVYVSFNDWTEVNKWDFEQVAECHSTEERQYITGIIQAEKLAQASWLHHPSVSVILLPQGIIESDNMLARSLKKFSLKLAGAN